MAKKTSTLKINASKQRVWDTLTKPELVKQWQYGSDLITTWQVGSPIRFRSEWQGKVFEQWGTVLKLQFPERIEYSLFAPRPDLEDKPENYFKMIYTLTSDNGNTRLEIVQEDHRPNAIQEEEAGEENPVLQSLKKIAESI